MSDKKVSIITATYNCVSKNATMFFYEMFRSIHEQDYPNIEHVIVDGGSEDGSVDFIKHVIEKYAKKNVVFISEKDRGINDATNKGYLKSSGDYITLMCDDDYYTEPQAISKLVRALEDNNVDFSCSDSSWLNKECWGNDIESFAYRHPFLINAFLFKRELINKPPYYLDEQYPLLADYDLFVRILKQENIKGCEIKDILTILRPGGFSQTDNVRYKNEMGQILKKHFETRFFTEHELYRIHARVAGFIIYFKTLLFVKNKKIRKSLSKGFSIHYFYKYFIRIIEYIFFFKFITNPFRSRVHNVRKDPNFCCEIAREWISTFYKELI